MNKLSLGQVITSIVILLIQVLLLKNIEIVIFETYVISILIYPLIIFLLPVGTRRSAIVLAAFFIGLFVDVFYDSIGVHAAAFVFTAFLRSFILKMLEPRLGYRSNDSITLSTYGTNWFVLFIGIMLFTHIFFYFSIDAFSFVYFTKILVNSLISFFVSFLIALLYKLLL